MFTKHTWIHFTHLFSALSQYKNCQIEKPLINNNEYMTWIVPLLVINRPEKVSVLLSYRLSVGSGWWWCVFTLTCAAWVLVSVVQQSFASDWVAGGCQQLFARWPLPSLGRQYCWVKVKLKESDSDRSSDISWWCKQYSRTVRPVVEEPVFFCSLDVSVVLFYKIYKLHSFFLTSVELLHTIETMRTERT